MSVDSRLNESKCVAIVVARWLQADKGALITGGVQRVVSDLIALFRGWNYRVDIFQKSDRDEVLEWSEGVTVRFVRSPAPSWGDLYFAFRCRRALSNYDLCCYATPEDGFPYFAKNSFAVQHGIWWDGPPGFSIYGLLVKGVQQLRYRVLCARVRGVLCVDTAFINYMRSIGMGMAALVKCRYVPNYVRLERIPRPGLETVRRRYAGRQLLFLRRFEPPRGASLFVRMCEALVLRGFKFSAKMVGEGSQLEEIRILVSRLHLDEIIEFSHYSLDDAYQVFDEAAISVVPSLWSEGTSLSAVESIAAGVPVICTDVGGLGNLIIPGVNGYVCPAEVSVMAEYIERLLTDLNGYEAMASRCLAMREAFSFERWSSSVGGVLRQLDLLSGGDGDPTIDTAPLL